MTLIALLTALLCIAGPLTIPVGPVPVSPLSAALLLTAHLLGGKRAALCCMLYLLLGLLGLPVLAGFTGGAGRLMGPTGGYLLGYLPMTWIAGTISTHTDRWLHRAASMLLGTLVLYITGTAWYCLQSGASVSGAMSICVWPFLPFDLTKIVIVANFAPRLKARLAKAGLPGE